MVLGTGRWRHRQTLRQWGKDGQRGAERAAGPSFVSQGWRMPRDIPVAGQPLGWCGCFRVLWRPLGCKCHHVRCVPTLLTMHPMDSKFGAHLEAPQPPLAFGRMGKASGKCLRFVGRNSYSEITLALND